MSKKRSISQRSGRAGVHPLPKVAAPSLAGIDAAIARWQAAKDAAAAPLAELAAAAKELIRLRRYALRRGRMYTVVGRTNFAVLLRFAAAWVKRHRRGGYWKVDRASVAQPLPSVGLGPREKSVEERAAAWKRRRYPGRRRVA